MDSLKQTSTVLGSVIVGAIAGAAAALLLAPKSGKETREELLDRANSLKAELDEYASDFSGKAKKVKEDLEKKFNIKRNVLQELFYEQLHKTILEYILEKKMQIVCEEIMITNKKITDILQENNLKNHSLFFKNFKGKYGLSPLKFRKKFKM